MELNNDLDIVELNKNIQEEKDRKTKALDLENYDLSDTENENQEADLDMLIFGNPVIPNNVLQHLP